MTAMVDQYQYSRQQMIAVIEQHVAEMSVDSASSQLAPGLLASLSVVPRHQFVAASLREDAYRDRPLPIGYEQTISQPCIVGLMTHLLKPQADHTVLEVGTGSGYQAAVLSALVKQIYSTEIVAPLAASSRRLLKDLQYSNVKVITGSGYGGLPAHAPYDGIIVTAAGDVPAALIEQLKPGGRMVIPVQEAGGIQYLTVVIKTTKNDLIAEKVLPVRFVPLIGS